MFRLEETYRPALCATTDGGRYTRSGGGKTLSLKTVGLKFEEQKTKICLQNFPKKITILIFLFLFFEIWSCLPSSISSMKNLGVGSLVGEGHCLRHSIPAVLRLSGGELGSRAAERTETR